MSINNEVYTHHMLFLDESIPYVRIVDSTNQLCAHSSVQFKLTIPLTPTSGY